MRWRTLCLINLGRSGYERANYQASGFQEQLDALVELAKAARDAVTAWPMPMKTP